LKGEMATVYEGEKTNLQGKTEMRGKILNLSNTCLSPKDRQSLCAAKKFFTLEQDFVN